MDSQRGTTAPVTRNGRGMRGDDLRRRNLSAIMRHVLDHPGLSRSEIAAQLEISQMQVSRLLRRTLRVLRESLVSREV